MLCVDLSATCWFSEFSKISQITRSYVLQHHALSSHISYMILSLISPNPRQNPPIMDGHAHPSSPRDLINELTMQNDFLRAQVQELNAQVLQLKVENVKLRSSATTRWALPIAQVYEAPNYNTLALPAAVESLDIMQQHFLRQGTLRQWYDRDFSSH